MSAEGFAELLTPGEQAAARSMPEHGSLEWQYGYQTIEITNSQHADGNSVLLDVAPRGAVEPVTILDTELQLTIHTLEGAGYAVSDHIIGPVFAGETSTSLHLLKPDAPPVYFSNGHTYYYLNPDEARLVLRDDATPTFTGKEEVSLFNTPRDSTGRPIENQAIQVSTEFLFAFGALSKLRHDQLNLREKVIYGSVYRGNHGIRYRALEPQGSADGYERTGSITAGVQYAQLDAGSYPRGTLWWRSEAEFLQGTEQINGQEKHIFTLHEMPLTAANLRQIIGS